MRFLTAALAAFLLAGCGPASRAIPAGALGISARDAFIEARTAAVTWDAGARLRYIEGRQVVASGHVLPGEGDWRFHYTAPGRAPELLVQVASLTMTEAEQPPTSPPGFVIGANVLGETWLDSPAVLERARAAAASAGIVVGATEPASLLLVPTDPVRWVVRFPGVGPRQWHFDARTGAALSP